MTTARFAIALAALGLLGGCIANPTPHPEDDLYTPTSLADAGNQSGGVDAGGSGGGPADAGPSDAAKACRQRGGFFDDADGSCRFAGADAGAMADVLDPGLDAGPTGDVVTVDGEPGHDAAPTADGAGGHDGMAPHDGTAPHDGAGPPDHAPGPDQGAGGPD